MSGTWRTVLWAVVFALLAALAVPWFLWRDASTAAGLPVWLWWHIGWMLLASAVFYAFTRHAWGIGMGVTDRG